jgi:hypothetical protein
MPIIRLLPETANKAWRAMIETGEPVHRIPPAQDNRYVISHHQLSRLQQLQLKFDILEETDGEPPYDLTMGRCFPKNFIDK